MPFFEDNDLDEEVPIPQIGTDLFEGLSDDEEPLDSGPVLPDVLLEAVETVEASVVRLDDEPEQENGVDESDDDDDDDEDIPTAPMEEVAAPRKRGRASLAAVTPKATPQAKGGASAGRKRKADAAADEPVAKRSGRGRATAVAASNAIKQDVSKRSRAPNGQAKAAPKKTTGAKRGRKPKAAQPEEEYEVERIDNHKVNGKTTVFYVKWKGYSDEENTWEPKSNLAHAADLLKEYEATAKKEKAAPTPKTAAATKKAPAQKQKPGPKPKKVAAKKAAAKPAGRGAVRSGRPKRT